MHNQVHFSVSLSQSLFIQQPALEKRQNTTLVFVTQGSSKIGHLLFYITPVSMQIPLCLPLYNSYLVTWLQGEKKNKPFLAELIPAEKRKSEKKSTTFILVEEPLCLHPEGNNRAIARYFFSQGRLKALLAVYGGKRYRSQSQSHVLRVCICRIKMQLVQIRS